MPDLFTRLESLPEFAEMPYDKQVELRMKLTEGFFRSPSVQQLDEEKRKWLMNQLIFRPAKFKNKALEQNVNSLIGRFKQGDKKAAQEIINIKLNDAAVKNSVVLNVLGEKLLGPVARQFDPVESAKGTRWWHILGTPEGKKAMQYIDAATRENERFSKIARLSSGIFGTAVNMAEIVGMTLPTAGTWLAPAGLGKAANAISRTVGLSANKGGRIALARGLKVLGHGAIEGVEGVIRENVLDVLTKANEDPSMANIVENSAHYFKDYFLWDVLFNFGLTTVLPTLRGSLTAFSLKKIPNRFMGGLTNEEWVDASRRVLSGQDVPRYLLDQMPEEAVRYLEGLRTTGRVHMNVQEMVPEDILKMNALRMGYELTGEPGSYTLRGIVNEVEDIKGLASLEDVRDAMVKQVDTVPLVEGETSPYGRLAGKFRARNIVSGQVNKADMASADIALNFISPVNGRFTREGIENFTKLSLKAADAPDDIVQSLKITQPAKGRYVVSLKGRKIASFPETPATSADELAPIQQIIKGIEDNTGNRVELKGLARSVSGQETVKTTDEIDKALQEYRASINKEWEMSSLYGRVSQGGSTAEDMAKYKKIFLGKSKRRVFGGYRAAAARKYDEAARVYQKAFPEDTGLQGLHNRLEQLREHAPTEATAVAHEDLLRTYHRVIAQDHLQTPEWARMNIKRYYGDHYDLRPNKTGGYELLKGKDIMTTFADFSELRRYVITTLSSPDDLAYYLRTHQGLYLRQADDKWILESRVHGREKGYLNTVYDEADSWEELVANNPRLFEKLPDKLGPRYAFLDESTVGVRYAQDSVVGSYESVLRHLDGFYSTKLDDMTTLKATEDGYVRVNKGGRKKQVEVFVDSIAERRTFDRVDEAIRWLKKSDYSADELYEMAARKGYVLDVSAGRYVLYRGNGAAMVLDDVDQVKAALKDVPIPEYAPELVPELQKSLLPEQPVLPEGVYKPPSFTHKGYTQMPGARGLGHLWRPKDAFFESYFKATGKDFFIRSFNDMEEALRGLQAIDYQFRQVMSSAFDDGAGKVLPEAERAKVFKYYIAQGMDAIDNGQRAVDTEKLLGITRQHKKAASRMGEIFGRGGKLGGRTGLAHAFAVDFDDLVTKYLPRMRKYYQANPSKAYTDGASEAFIDNALGGRAPKELKAFFENLRTSDLINMVLLDDPLEVMAKYASIGYKKHLVGPVWARIDKQFRELAPTLDPQANAAFNNYREGIMSIKTPMEDALLDTTNRVLKRLGVEKEVASDFLDYWKSMAYFASMGARPWIIIRNTLQPWTTLAPRVGNPWVAKGIRYVTRNPQAAFEQAYMAGAIRNSLPIAGVDSLYNDGVISKTLRKLLHFYGQSDSYTRAVAYHAQRLKFDDAASRLTKSKVGLGDDYSALKKTMTWEEFEELSGLKGFDDDIRRRAYEAVKRSDWRVAGDILGKKISDETMFNYRQGGRPSAFKGVVGKLFGMFGTYPVYYVENIRRALSHGSTASKIAYASTFLGNSFLLYEAFRNIGINANNFLFWQPATFQGGPLYHLANQALLSTSTHYEGRQARASLFGLTTKDGKVQFNPMNAELYKWLIPGSFQAKSIYKAIEAYNNNEGLYKALLHATSAPINQEWFQSGPDLPGSIAQDILHDLPLSSADQIPNLLKRNIY